MLPLLIAIAQGGVTAPEPIDPQLWVRVSDYPTDAVQYDRQGAAAIRIVVSPEGRAERCDILSAVGSTTLARLSCLLMKRRARFKPALDTQGQPTHGTWTGVSNFWLPDAKSHMTYPATLPADFQLQVSRLPRGAPDMVTLHLHALIDQQGELRACSVPENEVEKKLATLACERLPGDWVKEPLVDAAGLPITYVRSVRVTFTVKR